METSYLILYPLQFFYALGATLFFLVIPTKLFVPKKWLPEKSIIPLWLIISAVIAIFTTTNPPENTDPYNCRETRSGLRCE